MSDARIPLAEPQLIGNAQRYLNECVDTNFVSSVGPFVERFEREFAAFVGAPHAVACATGTAALHVALRLLGVGPGDEVWVPTLTFIASANPILYERATPVLVDAERATYNLDPQRVVDELERRARAGLKMPKAIEVVHLVGHPADIAPIADACGRHGVSLIEDAAEALGATYTEGPYRGRHVGTIGAVGCFSFNGNKIITTGGGGMLVTGDRALAARAKHLTTQARLPGYEYRHDEVGYNYRLTNLAAALGVAQLEALPDFLAKKRAIAERYDRELADLPGFSPAPQTRWAAPSKWLYTCRIDPDRLGLNRTQVLEALQRQAIECRPIWTPLHRMPMFEGCARLGAEVADELFAQCLSLPCSTSLSDAQQSRVVAVLRGLTR